jgi:MFS family permease
MPRRYLTIMNLFWGAGCLPLALVGIAGNVWVIAVAVFIVGVCFSAPMVIWGTLLQRRVPPHMLGRVSSLDFFVSLAFMPLSMAIAGPISLGIGLPATFALAGLLPTVIALLAIVLAKMPKDELAHPLDTAPDDTPTDAAATGAALEPDPATDDAPTSQPARA